MRCSLPAVHDVLLPPQGTAIHLERERRDVADGIDVGAARLEAAVDLFGGGGGGGRAGFTQGHAEFTRWRRVKSEMEGIIAVPMLQPKHLCVCSLLVYHYPVPHFCSGTC